MSTPNNLADPTGSPTLDLDALMNSAIDEKAGSSMVDSLDCDVKDQASREMEAEASGGRNHIEGTTESLNQDRRTVEQVNSLSSMNQNGGKVASAVVMEPTRNSLTSSMSLGSGAPEAPAGSDPVVKSEDPDSVLPTMGVNGPPPDPLCGPETPGAAGGDDMSGRITKTEGLSTQLSSTSITPASHTTPQLATGGEPHLGPVSTNGSAGEGVPQSSSSNPTASFSAAEEAVSVEALSGKLLQNQAALNSYAQESAKSVLNDVIQKRGLDADKVWEMVSKLKRFLNNLMQLASNRDSSVKQAVESIVHKLMYNQITEVDFVANLERDLNSPHQPNLLPFLKDSVPYLRLFLYHQQQFIKRYLAILQQKKKQPVSTTPTPAPTTTSSPTQPQTAPGSGGVASLPSAGVKNPATEVHKQALALSRLSPEQRQALLQQHPQLLSPQLKQVLFQLQQQQQQQQQQQTAAATSSKVDLTRVTPPPGSSLPPQVLLQMRQDLVKQSATKRTSSDGGGGTGPPVPERSLSMPAFSEVSQGAVSFPPTAAKGKSPNKAGKPIKGKKDKGYKAGTSGAPINIDEDDDEEDGEELAGVDLKEETAHFLPLGAVEAPSGHCTDETFLPVDGLKQRLARAAASKGIVEVADNVVVLVSHAVQERTRSVLEKLAVICTHRMESLRDDAMYEVRSSVKEQLKFLESIDRHSAQCKQEQEREKLLKAAKSRNKDDPEVARMKEQAKMMQMEQEEEIRRRAANQTALDAIGIRKRAAPTDTVQGGGSALRSSSIGEGVGGVGGVQAGPPRQKQKKRINLRDLSFYLEQERETRKSHLLYKTLSK